MADDWIKMRTWLSKDPRVIQLSHELALDKSFVQWLTEPVRRTCENAYEHVTTDVTVCVTVASLLVTWGNARIQGRRDGDDLVVDCFSLWAISEQSGIPGFGEAMGVVGWAIEQDDGSVRFPKFFVDKEPPEKRFRSKAAERQARYRKRQRESVTPSVTPSVTGDVTDNRNARNAVTDREREEKRREEKSNNPPNPPFGGKRKPVSICDLTFPPSLDRRDVRDAMTEWIEHKRTTGKGYKSTAGPQKYLNQFSRLPNGAARLIAAIDASIAANYAGIYEPKGATNGPTRTQPGDPDFGKWD